MGRLFRPLQQSGLLVHEGGVLPPGVAGQKDPAGPFPVRRERILRPGLPHFHGGPGMGQAGDHPQQDRQPHFFRQAEGIGHQVIAFLLVGRLQDGHQGELPVEARILLVLGRMHGRVVGGDHHQTALHAGHAGVHERIGTDIHAHMLHAHQRPLARIGHAQSSLHGRFLIGTPTAPHPAFPRQRIGLYEFRNLGRRGSGIGIHPGQPGVQRPQGKGLVPQQQSFLCHGSNTF